MPSYSRVSQLLAIVRSRFWVNELTLNQFDTDGLRFIAQLLVRLHWFVLAMAFVQIVYRPYYGPLKYSLYVALFVLLTVLNGYMHWRIRSKGTISWRWIFALCAMDIFLISSAVVIGDGFSHYFLHIFYYPALACLAVTFSSFRFNMVWVTMVAVIYFVISLTVGDGLDAEARDEKVMVARIFTMYAVAVVVNRISAFERTRWMQAVERERSLQQERVALSQVIHDTTAQSAYLIGLGLDTARLQAERGSPNLGATLEETSRLSRSIQWELRHPINLGRVYEGRDLTSALRSHASSFSNITSVPADMTQEGSEPPLSVETRGLLLSIAHNALTNAYRHAGPGLVSISIEFGESSIRLSVSDDGRGLPDDYDERGHGFENMRRAAEGLGGQLIVEKRGPLGGAAVTCITPMERGG